MVIFAKMPRCQAVNCDHMTGVHKMSFFINPDPERFKSDPDKYKSEKERVTKWFHNIGRGWKLGSFQFNKDKVLCEEHFEPELFQADVRASLMGYKPPKKRLTPTAVPTIFSHRAAAKKRPASIQRTEVRTKKEVIRPVSSCSF